MNEQSIEEIKNALREMMQLIVQRGEPLSNEMRLNIARVMEHAANRIQALRQETPVPEQPEEPTPAEQPTGPTPPTGDGAPPTGGPVPPLEDAPHESSNISRFRYEPESQRLYVQFLGKHPNPNGPVYSYEGVPENIFNVLRRGAVAPRTSGSNAWHTWREGTTPSHGAAMYALIREGGYPYKRLS